MRVFIALDISKDSTKNLIEIQDRLKQLSIDCKWVELEKHAHLTLRFWEDLDDHQVADVKTAIDVLKNTFKPLSVTTKEISSYSTLKKKQVLWYEMQDSFELINIHDFLSAQLEIRGFDHDEDEFLPHVTLGRLKARKNLNDYKKYLKKDKSADMNIEFISLSMYKSTLTNEGPEYELLHRI